MTAYYNEFDPKAAAWLRELIRCGLIAEGEVDERSILDVSPDDLRDFTQCHFFAGIGGWSYALRLAGWPDDLPVWTGSPPCQPFSAAGLQKGKDDGRHLAPHWATLISVGRPPIIFGEQVASAAVFGKSTNRARVAVEGVDPLEWAWLDDLFDRLEAAHYACGASDIPAAGIGAPHIRQRTFFAAVRLANTDDARPQGRIEPGRECPFECPPGPSGVVGGVANPDGGYASAEREQRGGQHGQQPQDSGVGGLAHTHSTGSLPRSQRGIYRSKEGTGPWNGEPERPCASERLANAYGGQCLRIADGEGCERHGSQAGRQQSDCQLERSGADCRPDPRHSPWGGPDWLGCRDGKWRPVESGTFPLAYGIPARVGRLRGYGNAIVPQVAAVFIAAFQEVCS